jgi:hypothetical protein
MKSTLTPYELLSKVARCDHPQATVGFSGGHLTFDYRAKKLI